ncbi:MAG: TetR family transcriptional regulator [Hyphomonadaceae bacterium]|nr:TetR family transcriptional regulator [Hyphomonadaceae bacterium]
MANETGEGKKQQRGQETRGKIVDAAIRLIARNGAASVTHRAVASEANVSLALTTYHFDAIEGILETAFKKLSTSEIRRFKEIYQASETSGSPLEDTVDYIATQVIREATEFREESIAGSELMIEAMRSETLAQAVDDMIEVRLDFWTATLKSLGSQAPRRDATIMLCSLLGSFFITMARGKEATELARTRKRILYDLQSLLSLQEHQDES